jgi:hypothetical protein
MATTHEHAQLDVTALLELVSRWPIEKRMALLHGIMRTLVPAAPQPRTNTWEQARGLLAGPWPVPPDEDVERMPAEYRAEKYG